MNWLSDYPIDPSMFPMLALAGLIILLGGFCVGYLLSPPVYEVSAGIWLPIKSAPRNGEKILLWAEGWRAAYVGWWVEGCDCDGWMLLDDGANLGHDTGFLGWQEDADDDYMPTHWQVMPSKAVDVTEFLGEPE